MDRLAFDIAHLFAGGLVLVSFMMLYQDRLYSLLNVFALHAVVLALSVAWQASTQTFLSLRSPSMKVIASYRERRCSNRG